MAVAPFLDDVEDRWLSADAAAIAGGPLQDTDDAVTDGGAPRRECQLCGREKPHVRTVTLPPFGPIEVDGCLYCRWMYGLFAREGCLRCGADASNYVELEAPVEASVDVDATVAGSLCDDCAGDVLLYHLTAAGGPSRRLLELGDGRDR